MKVLTAQQMRDLDRLTVERCGIPYATLMETAGARVVEAIILAYGSIEGKSFTVYCGKGNNGGDGAVVARLLWMRRAVDVDVLLFGSLSEVTGEARVNLEAVKKLAEQEQPSSLQGIKFREVDDDVEDVDLYAPGSFVIDALLGTGVTRPVEGLYARAINAINESGHNGSASSFTKIISIDLPSGLAADSLRPIGPFVLPHLTVTFSAPKIANVAQASGELVVAPIGTPPRLIDGEASTNLFLVEAEQIISWLFEFRRAADAHKTSVGDVLLIAGSRGKTGAAALSSEAILRAGAGLVTVATARSAQSLLVTQTINEVMTEPLDETEGGAVAHDALDRALQLAEKRTVLALGPGLSSSDESTRRFVREFVAQRTAPIVIDADGLNALAPWPEDLQGSDERPIIITPHPGEMARLIGKSSAEVNADRINVAREFATKHHVITVLKGSRSLIAAPDGEVYINPTGNAGMATAGSGDVLTGLTAGLLAQRPEDPLGATLAAVYLHGLAGDLAADKLGMRSLLASDILAHLSAAILQVGGKGERPPSNRIMVL